MLPEERDTGYIWDIVDAARTIGEFTAGMTVEAYVNDRKLQLAVERLLEIIGEAARRLSDTFKNAHPETPWRDIISQRNVVAHEYGKIVPERIWLVVTNHIPDLIARLEPLLPPAPDA